MTEQVSLIKHTHTQAPHTTHEELVFIMTPQGAGHPSPPPDCGRPSMYKNCLVWVALSCNIRQLLSENIPSDEAFYRFFAVGQLHLVTSSDVTNSKVKIRPRIEMPGSTESAAPGEPAEPDPEAAPGIVMVRGREVARLQSDSHFHSHSHTLSISLLPACLCLVLCLRLFLSRWSCSSPSSRNFGILS